MNGIAGAERFEFAPRKKRLRRRAAVLSALVFAVTLILSAILLFLTGVYLPLQHLHYTNSKTSQKINCDLDACDVTALSNDFEFDGSNYAIDTDNYFFLNFEPVEGSVGFSLHQSDTNFIGRFHNPTTFSTPVGEVWRLYSAQRQVGAKPVCIMVGYALKASWRMTFPPPPTDLIDSELKGQLETIASALREQRGNISLLPAVIRKITADGFEVVDSTNDRILAGAYWIPVYFPQNKPLPSDGTSLHTEGDDLWLVRTDRSDRLLLVAMHSVGDWRVLLSLLVLPSILAAAGAYFTGITTFRKYLLLRRADAPSVDAALKAGEGVGIEFKRSLSPEIPSSLDQVLQTITAFANTGDGAIFIGIEDSGHIRGTPSQSTKERDTYHERIYQAVRTRIRPSPPVRIDHLQVRELWVCRLFVPRGNEPLHFLDGAVYVRHGASDIKAQPEMVRRILEEYSL